MDLELRHLRILCAIADAGSVARAGAVLGYSQQALSAQLHRIEQHFGRAIFERSPVGVRPTGYGLEILAQARDVVVRADAISRMPKETATPSRTLRLAATNSPVLAGMTARLSDQLPGLGLTVSSAYASSDMVERLERGDLDAAIAADYPGLELGHSDAVAHRGIATEPTFVALPACHPLRQRLQVGLADLAGEAWFLTPDDGAGWPGVFYAACAAAGFTPVKVHEFLGDHRQLQGMIAAGVGVSPVQATFRPAAGVIVKALTGTPVWCRYVLAWRQDSVSASLAEALFAAARAAYREQIAQSPHFQAWVLRTYKTSSS
ncbi:LysR family transcriptional regulator [Kutzneria sp. CA-103260]|uniref:LysR substrate-binding domain-containing protein n=1 Tax=Kutzneria sp. CA-103260 TaxID=2802641 RepID=UPI001BACE4A1|nr:LysR family transcriptional regulator [Kutzneria sp. CA-103260]QUQ64381.1 LysR family transcriptional regulator [Kutzneria sp. CA-103260]